MTLSSQVKITSSLHLSENVLPAPYVYGVRPTSSKKKKRDVDHGKQRSYRQVLERFEPAFSKLPDCAEDYYYRGKILARAGEVQRAINEFTCAIAFANDFALAYCDRGTCSNTIGLYHDAIADFDMAIKLNCDLIEAQQGLGAAYSRQLCYREAREAFTACIKIAPQDPTNYLERARTNWHLSQYDQALADCNSAIIIDTDSVEGHTCRAVSYAAMGQYSAAIDDLTKAIELDENYSPAYLLRSELYRECGSSQWIADRQCAIKLDANLHFGF